MEVLHGAFDDAVFTTDRFVAETFQVERHPVHLRLVILNVLLEVVKHVKIWLLEDV